ncbi:5,6-dimethylbenzimidazole synthase [Amycolatopsis alkalitolerans]|uniref:Nicotinate-nucleotide--dimethylbenzimidazole phosphoribosyltransferase n=1 Tax=Amycolatopsis alkalitolerans TaxID=2547244 RepID=A0A5C4M0D1_9PSEU|nr:5,6-dimethylbenzimidazole synthase [Amycolatopsis alkalitolerans]TNC25860.1 5,6-dimethylbenzimidazole synthase [Amycolatopsis alkalitolerans]
MVWPRAVPVIGDRSSAAERASRPDGWAFPVAEREALYRIIGARRDVRRFRPDPVPEDVLDRVLGAGHAAPSVGHSQPWRFLVVTEPGTRERASVLADRARLAQAARLDPESARKLLDLQLEGLREAPVGVVVCCDRRTPAEGVLGRATFPDADVWSCACAIENLWLAARAEGLGLGWVTLFEPADLAALLGVPDGVVTLGWLCLGWPDERPPDPGLERAGWSRRLPVSAVVHRERWPVTGEPAAPPSHLRAPDQRAVVGVRDQADRLLAPPGSLGVLDRAADRVLALPAGDRDGGTLLLVGADHPVCRHGVSAYEGGVTGEVMAAAVAGQAQGVVAARTAGLQTLVVDAGVGATPVAGAIGARPRDARGDLVEADALSEADTGLLLRWGRDLGRRAARRGVVALGEVGVGNTTVAAALAAGLLGVGAGAVVGLGSGADSAMLARKTAVVEAALARVGSGDPVVLLRVLGGPEFAVLAGAVLGAAAAGVAVVMDGLATSVAAALAVAMEPAVAAHLVAGQRSRETAHAAVLGHLGLEPLLDLRMRAGEGVGACFATRLLRDTIHIRRDTAKTGEP